MADNTTQNGTANIATDEVTNLNGAGVSAVHVQRTKVGYGAENVFQDVSDANPLPVEQNAGFVSLVNSSAAPLAANGTFTGVSEDVTQYPYISVSVFASHASATDGLQIQQSQDAINWDLSDVFTIPAATNKTFSVGRVQKFFRVVFMNGTTAQSAFRLQVMLNRLGTKDSSVRPQDGRSNDNDFNEHLAYQMLYNDATNSWSRARGEAAPTFRGRTATFRTPGRGASATGQRLFTIFNGAGSTKIVSINSITVDLLQNAAMTVATIPAIIRIYRITTAATNGAALSKTAKDTALTSNASITVWGDSTADGTIASPALTSPVAMANVLTQEYAARLVTAAGYESFDRETFLEGADVVLRAGEGLVLSLDYTAVAQNPTTNQWLVGCDWTEI